MHCQSHPLFHQLAALLALMFFISSPLQAQNKVPDKASLDRWEPAIMAFEAANKTASSATNGIVFYGSSSIRLWKTLTNDFEGLPVINRGFGGSQIADCTRYFSRAVAPLRPRVIVFYAGDNDISEGKTPGKVFEDFQRFVHKVHWSLPETKIIFLSIKPSPARWHHEKSMLEANKLVEAFCRQNEKLHYVDIHFPMLDEKKNPKEELFAGDRLHLSPKGYELWTSLLKPHLRNL